MKTIFPVLALVCLIGLAAGSSILYLNMEYLTSALCTVSWVLGISFLIGYKGKHRETK